jgi:vancomycin permeability regulator SanA
VRFLKWLLVVILLLAAYPAYLALSIWQQSHHDELHPADAIVVLGAAQYNGTPSPVFKARLAHAEFLYNNDFSDTVIVTGGKEPGDQFTEAEAARKYLEEHGIPSDHILSENAGRNTLESLRGVRQVALQHDIHSVLLVSDPLHGERIKAIAGDLGLRPAYASPDSYVDLNRSRSTKAGELLHETASLLFYKIFKR